MCNQQQYRIIMVQKCEPVSQTKLLSVHPTKTKDMNPHPYYLLEKKCPSN